MKKIIRYAGALLLAAGFVACSEWNVPERETFENQENLEIGRASCRERV